MTAPTPAQAQQQHETTEDLVTEEMVAAFLRVMPLDDCGMGAELRAEVAAALRAVAPLIAARALEKPFLDAYAAPAVAAEREAIARLADSRAAVWARARSNADNGDETISNATHREAEAKDIAAATRARGNP